MPFAELLKSMRQALVYLHRAIPESEKALKSSARENEGATSSLVSITYMFLWPTCTVANKPEFPARIRKLALRMRARDRLCEPRVRASLNLHPPSLRKLALRMRGRGRHCEPRVRASLYLHPPRIFLPLCKRHKNVTTESERMTECDGNKYDVFYP